MRLITTASLVGALGLLAAPAMAATAVNVSISPELQAMAEKTYGVRDINELAADLQKSVERQLARTGAYDGATLDLVLVDAVPNRPTFKQLGATLGLSMQSFGVGGAEITGRAVTSDGKVTPLGYSFYEPDIRQEWGRTTWSDAQWTFDRFAYALVRGKALAAR